MTRTAQFARQASIAAQYAQSSDDELLYARRALNGELRERGYCTEEDAGCGLGVFIVTGFLGMSLGLCFGSALLQALAWVVTS